MPGLVNPFRPTAANTLVVNAQDYGARPDGTTDNAPLIQAAYDALAAQLAGTYLQGVLYLPSGPHAYNINSPIYLDASNITVHGDGWGTSLYMLNQHSALVVGVSRKAVGPHGSLVIDSTYRPDCVGKLDTSLAPASAVRWGIRTQANAFVQFQASALSAGVAVPGAPGYSDNWGSVQQLTVEFCAEPPDGQSFPPGTPLLGFSDNAGQTSPWGLETTYQANRVLFRWRASDQGPTQSRCFDFDLGTATPPYRIAVQLDLVTATYSVFVNGVQVGTVDHSPTWQPGLRLAANDCAPCMIGSFGPTAAFGKPTGVDLRLYGLRVSNTLRYQNNGVGKPQTRADVPSTAINDAWAYAGDDAATIAVLTATDNPKSESRLVTVQGGGACATPGISSGFFLHTAMPAETSLVAIRDLDIQCSGGYGAGILLGAVLDAQIDNARIRGGYYGIGSFNLCANYYINVSRCQLDGADSPYYGYCQMIWAREVNFLRSGRVTVRLVDSCATWEHVFVERPAPSGVSERVFQSLGGDNGGRFSLSDWVVDYEGDSFAEAPIFCAAHREIPATSLDLKNLSLGTVGAVPLIELQDTGSASSPDLNPCWIRADNVTAYGPYAAHVSVDGPLWHGEVTGVAFDGPRLVHRQTWGTRANVVIRERTESGPPTTGTWYAGAHCLEDYSAPAGGGMQWRCTQSGTFGTPTPPVFADAFGNLVQPYQSLSAGAANV